MKKEIKMKRYLVAEIDGVLSFGLKVATPRYEGNHCWRTQTTTLFSSRLNPPKKCRTCDFSVYIKKKKENYNIYFLFWAK